MAPRRPITEISQADLNKNGCVDWAVRIKLTALSFRLMLFGAAFSLSDRSADDPNTFVYDARHVFARLDYIDGTLERTRVAGKRC